MTSAFPTLEARAAASASSAVSDALAPARLAAPVRAVAGPLIADAVAAAEGRLRSEVAARVQADAEAAYRRATVRERAGEGRNGEGEGRRLKAGRRGGCIIGDRKAGGIER